jgi:hypothetical protein
MVWHHNKFIQFNIHVSPSAGRAVTFSLQLEKVTRPMYWADAEEGYKAKNRICSAKNFQTPSFGRQTGLRQLAYLNAHYFCFLHALSPLAV